jgi:hypothetical protein
MGRSSSFWLERIWELGQNSKEGMGQHGLCVSGFQQRKTRLGCNDDTT